MSRPRSSEWMGVIEVAELVSASTGTVRRWADIGLIPVYRIGLGHGHRRFRREDVARFVTERMATTNPRT